MLVNVHDAKTNLSKLLAQVEAGEEVVIGRNGVPVARLVKVEPRRRRRSMPEEWREQLWIAPDAFSEELDAVIAAEFEGPLWPDD